MKNKLLAKYLLVSFANTDNLIRGTTKDKNKFKQLTTNGQESFALSSYNNKYRIRMLLCHLIVITFEEVIIALVAPEKT